MKSTLLLDRAEPTFVVVFDKGEEVVHGLTAFASRESLRASHVTAIGALSGVVLGYFDRQSRHGGHLLEGHVWPTLEVIVEESPRHLQRGLDPASGLALIDLGDRAAAA